MTYLTRPKIPRIFLICLVAFGAIILSGTNTPTSQFSTAVTTVGDPELLQLRYEAWKEKRANVNAGELVINLVEATQHGFSSLKGQVHLNVRSGKLSAHIVVDGAHQNLGLWATQDAQLYALDKPNANLTFIGELSRTVNEINQATFTLDTDVSELAEQDFQLGQFVVAPMNSRHLQEALFVGSPSLFQRLYVAEQTEQVQAQQLNFINLLVPVAHAGEATGFPDVFNDLVTLGEEVFFNETFDGNGRSCGTCHPATNNFTIDNDFIASLPMDDPLFVAEFVPALIFGAPENLDAFGNPQRFENPALMRAFGLIVENVDGMGDLDERFTMRSVPHNIGMSVSVTTPPNDLTPPDDRTGWSGEGAPSGLVGGVAASGRVRDFLLGAIVQHYPKTMARSFAGPSPDFRVATIDEIDGVEAFLFALGRQQELVLTTGAANELILNDASAEAGKALFRDGVAGGNRTCNGCHSNAGANIATGVNRNFNTGVELFLQNRINNPQFTVVGEPRPVDGGFGTNPNGDFTSLVPQPGFVNENFGNKQFNTTSLVEAADSPPFFHNNIAATLEDSIAFYNSPEFLAENGGSIPFTAAQIDQVANFLRAINAVDNIENLASPRTDRALSALTQFPIPNDVISRLLKIATADLEDARQVLDEGGLHNHGGLQVNAVLQLRLAILSLQQAMNSNANAGVRTMQIEQAKNRMQAAITIIKAQG